MAIPMPQPFLITMPLESPFAWETKSYTLTKKIALFPAGSEPVAFYATRCSKILGYIPVIGTFIGISRISQGIKDYKNFNENHLHSLSHRSVKWIVRGILECIPLLGGLICMIIDIIATYLSKGEPEGKPFADQTPCGFCHTCSGFCKC